MKQQDFENAYADQWDAFADTVNTLKARTQPPPPQFPEHYRQICNHLSLARQRHYSDSVIQRLNQLVMDGHHLLYQRDNRLQINQLSWALSRFVATLRSRYQFLLIATLLFVVPGFLAGIAAYSHDTLIYSLITPEQVSAIEAMYDPALEKIGRDRGSDTDLAMFGYYIKHNIGIAFQTFAGGIFWGLGSIFFLSFNGLYIGAVAGRLTSVGYSSTFYPFVIGHGAFELTAIVFSGAAGLIIGYALIKPGALPRLQALKIAAQDAVKIMYGATFMLFVAAFLEAFWSSSTHLPIALKISVGGFLWLSVIWFCFLSPFGARREPV